MTFFESLTESFVPRGKEPERVYRARIGKFQGWTSIVVNILLFLVKFMIGIMVRSVSVIADAIHTLSDVVSSAVVIWGFNEAEKPADYEHPYGHGRAEYIATLVIAILLCVAGIEFIEASVKRILNPEPLTPAWWMILAVLATIGLKEVMARFAGYLSGKITSDTLKADAWHHRSDAISSFLVVIAMVAGRAGYYALDGYAGLGVALFIIWTGIEIARNAIDDLLGKPPTDEEIEEIRKTAQAIEGVLGVHDIAVHSYGNDKFASIHIEIDASETPSRSHDIAERVEEVLRKNLNVAPTVHIDPVDPSHPIVQEVRTYLENYWAGDKRIKGFHDIRVVDTEEHQVILFGVNLQRGLSRKSVRNCCEEIEASLRKVFKGYEIIVKVSGLHLY
ncbi:MAG: cation transporter [FCB group bacterium]|nr:cation transporter [FCB group bacterium]